MTFVAVIATKANESARMNLRNKPVARRWPLVFNSSASSGWGGVQVLAETLEFIQGASHEGREENRVDQYLVQPHLFQAAVHPVDQGVDQTEGDIREAQPAQIRRERQSGVLRHQAAQRCTGLGRQGGVLQYDEEHQDQQDGGCESRT